MRYKYPRNVKLKILFSTDIREMEKEFNEFTTSGIEVLDTKLLQKYEFETGDGFVSYHIFYLEDYRGNV